MEIQKVNIHAHLHYLGVTDCKWLKYVHCTHSHKLKHLQTCNETVNRTCISVMSILYTVRELRMHINM